MQSRIYRFQIVRALVNGVFEARDTDNGSPVTLYEWTPATADRDAAKLRLSELQEQVHCETFSADASLYLCAPSLQAAEEALEVLHSHNLFIGIRPDSPLTLDPLEAHSDDPPIIVRKDDLTSPPPPQDAPRGSVLGWTIAIIFCAVVAFAVGNSYGDSAATKKLGYFRYRASSAQEQLDALNNSVHLLRVWNRTSSGVRVAVMYKNWSGVWVFSGWQTIGPDASPVVASSPNADFYYTAYDPADGIVWTGENPKDAYPTPRNNFLYSPFQGPRPSASRTKLFHVSGDFTSLKRGN